MTHFPKLRRVTDAPEDRNPGRLSRGPLPKVTESCSQGPARAGLEPGLGRGLLRAVKPACRQQPVVKGGAAFTVKAPGKESRRLVL